MYAIRLAFLAVLLTGCGQAALAAEPTSEAQLDQTRLFLTRSIFEAQLEELNLTQEKVKTLPLTPAAQAKADTIIERQIVACKRVLAEVDAGRKPSEALLKDVNTKDAAMAVMQLLSPEQRDTLVRRIKSPQADGKRMLRVLRKNLGTLEEIKPEQLSAAEKVISEAASEFHSLPDERPVEAVEVATVRQRYLDMSGALGVKLSGILTIGQRDELFGMMPILTGKARSQVATPAANDK